MARLPLSPLVDRVAAASRSWLFGSRHLSASPPSPVRVATVALSSPDPIASSRFYTDIVQLTQRSALGRIELWDRVGVGAGLSICLPGPDPSANDRVVAFDAMLTYGVSNLRTALRQVLRRGGRVEVEPGQLGFPLTEALISDPDGRYARLVHAFRRTPLANVSIVCEDPHATATALGAALGLAPVAASERHLVLPPLLLGMDTAVLLTGGPPHSSTAIACIPRSSLSAWPRRPESVDARLTAVAGPVVHLHVAGSVGAARGAVTALGWPATEVSTSAFGLSFTCFDSDENAFEVSGDAA